MYGIQKKISVLLALLLLAGCKATEAKPEGGIGGGQELYQDTVSLITDSRAPFWPYVQGKTGCYEMLLSADAEVEQILYTDFDAKQRIYLCADPNCTHSDESCTSWMGYTTGGSQLFANREKDKLFYLQAGLSEAEGYPEGSNAKLFSMDMDGSNRQLFLDFEEQGQIWGAFAEDSNYLYFMVMKVDQHSGDPYKQLWRAGLGDGRTELLENKLYNDDRIVAAYGSCLVLQELTSSGITYKQYDLQTRETSTLYEFPYSELKGTSAVFEGIVFTLSQGEGNTGTLGVYDLKNNSVKTIDNIPSYGEDVCHLIGFYDKKFLVYSTTDRTDVSNIHFLKYGVDIETGAVQELTLKCMQNGYERPINILTETENDFLVIYDVHKGAVKTMWEGVLTEMAVPEAPVLGLIAKEDYYNNVPNFIPITDHVMG